MAYDAIVAGARGLFFFGGQFKQVMNAADRELGWNWTYWRDVQRPLLVELTDPAHTPALIAPVASIGVAASAGDIAFSARESSGFLYLIAVRKSPTATGTVHFSGLPAGITSGIVLAHPGCNPERDRHGHRKGRYRSQARSLRTTRASTASPWGDLGAARRQTLLAIVKRAVCVSVLPARSIASTSSS